jgi:protease-4
MYQQSFGREIANVALRVVAVIVTVVLIISFSSAWVEYTAISDGTCNIAVLPIEGQIMPYGDFTEEGIVTNPSQVRTYLDAIMDDEFIEGVLIEINSPGGAPVASAAIAEMIHEFPLPTVGLIGDLGASGGYLVAAASKHLIASPMSTVGSIGVTMSYLDNTIQNENEGLTFVELASGEFKEAGNPNRPLTEEERDRFERDLETMHDAFIDTVASYRALPRETVAAVADGYAYTGKDALDKQLIDALGGRSAAREHFAATLGIDPSSVTFCEYVPSEWWI